jgi:ribosomal protein L18E
MKQTGPTNTNTKRLAVRADKHGKKEKQNVYRIISNLLQKPKRVKAEVNISHLEKWLKKTGIKCLL